MTKLYDRSTFERRGALFRVTFPSDHDASPPWERSDGHGVVTWWQSYERDPTRYWVLSRDRSSARFYDVRQTLAIAKRDGWGLGADDKAAMARRLGRAPTQREITKEAIRRDYQFLYGWCNDQWSYVGVVVELLTPDGRPTGEERSLWGVESFGDYATECAHELADEMLNEIGAAKDDAVMNGG